MRSPSVKLLIRSRMTPIRPCVAAGSWSKEQAPREAESEAGSTEAPNYSRWTSPPERREWEQIAEASKWSLMRAHLLAGGCRRRPDPWASEQSKESHPNQPGWR